MTTDLKDYLRDGADPLSRAILAIIQGLEIEDWEVSRWSDGRKQGYTIYCKTYNPIDQRNITFYETGSTNIELIVWHFSTLVGIPPNVCDFEKCLANNIEIISENYEAFDFKSIVERIEELMAGFDCRE